MKRSLGLICGTIAVVSLLAVSMPAFAGSPGAKEGGGGAQIEAAFRLRGYSMIADIADNPRANLMCPATLLRHALDHSTIKIVDQLVNPYTGKPVSPMLDAWTIPGYIQLKQSSWEFLVSPFAPPYVHGRSVNMLILHELYRATGRCNDNNFRISERVIPLITNGGDISTYSESFTFKYLYCRTYSTGPHFYSLYPNRQAGNCDNGSLAVCNKPINILKANGSIVCLDGGDRHFYLYKSTKISEVEKASAGWSHNLPSFRFHIDGTSPDEVFLATQKYQSLLPFVSPQHPLLVVHDIRNDIWSIQLQ